MKYFLAVLLGFLLWAQFVVSAEAGMVITHVTASFEKIRDAAIGTAQIDEYVVGTDKSSQTMVWRFTKIADTNTAIPGGAGNFSAFEGPSLDAGNVAFLGLSPAGKVGIYTDINGLRVVANMKTAIPGGSGNFTDFGLSPSVDSGHVAFLGLGKNQQEGIYTDIDGLQVVADRKTTIPRTAGHFVLFTNPLLDGGTVAFRGRGRGDHEGVYTNINGLQVVADTNTLIPGGSGKFIYFGATLSLDGTHVAFRGLGNDGQQGIYTDINGLQVVADTNTVIPGGSETFLSFGDPSLDGGKVAFRGIGRRMSVVGIYTNINGLQVVADTHTAIPGGSGKFFAFDEPSLDGGKVAFRGFGTNQQGIYTNMGGVLSRIIDLQTVLDGKKMANLFFGREGLCGTSVVFRATFTDATLSIYRADLVPSVNEPSPVQAGRPAAGCRASKAHVRKTGAGFGPHE